MSLAQLLPDADYEFQMGLRRGSIEEFFGPGPDRQLLIAERAKWLGLAPRLYAAVAAGSLPLLEEAHELAQSLGNPSPRPGTTPATGDETLDRCCTVGLTWEPDFLLLKAEARGEMVLHAGCVCFPSSWSLPEKMGQPMPSIHGAVPGLNEQLGKQVQSFLARIKPGAAWLRSNWGLSRSSELNHHPDRPLPRLDDSVDAEDVWLRVEHQALVALPANAGILFGIRIALHSLAEVRSDPQARIGLTRALRTMPERVAQYKGLVPARSRLIQLLESSTDLRAGI